MRFIIASGQPINWKVSMNRLGYHEHGDRQTGQVSFIRRLRQMDYPRFHVYLEPIQEGVAINLHLDEKKASYEGFNRHGGQYDGDLVLNEAQRIQNYLQPPSA